MPTVLVTGGGGFIGTWVARELLRRELRVIVFDQHRDDSRWARILGRRADDVIFVSGSLLDRESLASVCDDHGVTNMIHLAALLTPACQHDPWLGCEVNVLGTVALFEVARERRDVIRGISWASSRAVYGPEPDEPSPVMAARLTQNRPPSFYGAFKKAAELIAEQYWLQFGIPSVGIRPHVVYGPERTQGLTAGPSLAARAAAEGIAAEINYTGTVGYDYVEDVARAFVRAAVETPPGASVVDLPSEMADMQDVVAAIRTAVPDARISVSGPVLPANTPPRLSTIENLFPDWQTTSLADGMRRTVDFYRNHTDHPL